MRTGTALQSCAGCDMSHLVTAEVYKRRIGSMLQKAVLLRMADRANDDGSDVWMSKQTIANEIEASRRGVISTVLKLVERGLLIEVGRHKQYRTVRYNISMDALRELPLLVDDSANLHPSKPKVQKQDAKVHQLHPIGEPGSPKPSIHPIEPTRARARDEIFSKMILQGAPVRSVNALSAACVDYDGGSMVLRSRWARDRAMNDLEQWLKSAKIRLVVQS